MFSLQNLKHQSERSELYFSKKTLDPSSAASIFAPPKMPGSTMGKSDLLYDAGQASNAQNGSNTVLDMDLMQKQKMQQRLIVNEDVLILIFIFIY